MHLVQDDLHTVGFKVHLIFDAANAIGIEDDATLIAGVVALGFKDTNAQTELRLWRKARNIPRPTNPTRPVLGVIEPHQTAPTTYTCNGCGKEKRGAPTAGEEFGLLDAPTRGHRNQMKGRNQNAGNGMAGEHDPSPSELRRSIFGFL